MKKKENKGTGSHGIGNRTVIGIICIVAALLICFGVAPVVNRISDGKVAIVRVIRQVEAGAVIGADDVAVVEVGRHNLPGGLVTKTEDVIGKCAKSDLYAGDYILKDKLTGTEKTAKDLLGNLGSGKKAISVTIPSFGNGFSGKLRTGDIVSIIVYDNTENRAFTPKELQYVKVITTTTSQGVDHEDVEDGTQPVTITFLVNAEQAELLSLYINTDAPSAISASSLDTKNRGMANSATKPDFTMQFAIYCSGVVGMSAVRRSASSCSRLYSLIFSLPARVPAISFSQSSIGLVFLFCLFPRLCVDLETAKDGTRSRSDRISPSPREATVATRMGMIIGGHLTFCIRWASCIGT